MDFIGESRPDYRHDLITKASHNKANKLIKAVCRNEELINEASSSKLWDTNWYNSCHNKEQSSPWNPIKHGSKDGGS